jgi:hypothetical protein
MNHLGQHMSQSLNKTESHLVKLRMDTDILEPLHLNMEATQHMHLVSLDIHHLIPHLCHLSTALSLRPNMKLQSRKDSGLRNIKNSNGSSLCMVDLLRMGLINLKSHRQGEQWKSLNKCNNKAGSWVCRKSIERVAYLRFLRQSKVLKVSLADPLMNLVLRVSLAGCSVGSAVELVVHWGFLAQ